MFKNAYTWGVSGIVGDPSTASVYLRQIVQTFGGGGGASRGISLQDLLGGKTPQNAGQ